MKQSLRDFLKARCGMSDAELDKLEDRPDGDDTLRKGAGDSLLHPAWTSVRKAYELLDEIQQSLDCIMRGDRERAAFARGVDMMNGAGHNGLAGIDVRGTNK
jgi:hypothetical protein